MAQSLIPYESLKTKGITLSKVQIWRLERDGKFPLRVQISAARHAWIEAEIDEWLAVRIAARSERSRATTGLELSAA
jgi:prophage regulatory protein